MEQQWSKIPLSVQELLAEGAVDLLAFGPHPDDVELNIGGILAQHAKAHRVWVVDLTAGELASNGTVETRRSEGTQASEALGILGRTNLGLPDGGIDPHDPEQQARVIWAIRKFRPEVMLVPYWEDRHPDHAMASALIDLAIFKSGLKKYVAPEELAAYRPRKWYYYPQHQHVSPDIIVDITDVYGAKEAAIAAYQSQFGVGEKTYINRPVFLQKIRARDQYFGAMIDAQYGEGLISKEPLGMKDLFQLKGGV